MERVAREARIAIYLAQRKANCMIRHSYEWSVAHDDYFNNYWWDKGQAQLLKESKLQVFQLIGIKMEKMQKLFEDLRDDKAVEDLYRRKAGLPPGRGPDEDVWRIVEDESTTIREYQAVIKENEPGWYERQFGGP